jgi:hypothetical protein
VQVRFVGCGDAFGSGGRGQTCIMVRAAGQVMLVDCGATILSALRSQGLDPQAVDTVAVTHLHGDHFGGLPFLILDGQFRRRTAPLRIIGPPGTAARLASAMETLFPGSSSVGRRFDVEVSELTPGGSIRAGGLLVRGWEVVHANGAPPLALRVEDGRSRHTRLTSLSATTSITGLWRHMRPRSGCPDGAHAPWPANAGPPGGRRVPGGGGRADIYHLTSCSVRGPRFHRQCSASQRVS